MSRPVVIDKISKSSLFLNRTQQELTFICNPIIEEGKVTGTLGVVRIYNPHISYDEDNQLLSIIGSMIFRSVRSRQERLEEMEVLKQKNIQLQNQLEAEFRPGNNIGNSDKMRDVYSLARWFAATNPESIA